MKNKSKSTEINICRLIWSNIRRFQYLEGMTDERLAEALGITTRTLYDYNKDPSKISLDKIQSFVEDTNYDVDNLLAK